jgi:hypothetical protein
MVINQVPISGLDVRIIDSAEAILKGQYLVVMGRE